MLFGHTLHIDQYVFHTSLLLHSWFDWCSTHGGWVIDQVWLSFGWAVYSKEEATAHQHLVALKGLPSWYCRGDRGGTLSVENQRIAKPSSTLVYPPSSRTLKATSVCHLGRSFLCSWPLQSWQKRGDSYPCGRQGQAENEGYYGNPVTRGSFGCWRNGRADNAARCESHQSLPRRCLIGPAGVLDLPCQWLPGMSICPDILNWKPLLVWTERSFELVSILSAL